MIEDYKGMTLEEAKAKLSTTRIIVRVENEQSHDIKPGTIIRQEQLLPNEKVDPRIAREIKLVVSTYVEIVVPPLVGTAIESAKSQLEEMGVKVVLNKLSTENMSETELAELKYNVVVDTTPGVGSLYSQLEDNAIVIDYY